MTGPSVLLAILAAPAIAQLNPSEFNVGKHHKLVECRDGTTFLINKKDTWIGRSLDVYGEWAQEEIALLSEFIKEGDIVADVGANIGSFTVPMAKMVGSTGKVVAFEAQRVVSQLLNANLALNEIVNVGVYNVVVGDSKSPFDVPEVIYSEEANFGAVSLLIDWKAQGGRTTPVPQVRLDDVFASQCPSFMKIDVEGMELMVLRGAQQVLKNKHCNTVLYMENNCKKGSRELLEYVTSLGYVCHWHVNPYHSPSNFRGTQVDIFPANANSINMLCFPGDHAGKDKLPRQTRIDVSSGRFLLHDYNLVYTGKENVVLAQLGTLESCER